MRFVILHHTQVASPHFDLMLEMEPDALLTTFRCPAWPPTPGDNWEELPEHRRIYLDYEGPVSGGRGHVQRVAAGTVTYAFLGVDPPKLGLSLLDAQAGACELSIAHTLETGVESATRWRVQTVNVRPVGE